MSSHPKKPNHEECHDEPRQIRPQEIPNRTTALTAGAMKACLSWYQTSNTRRGQSTDTLHCQTKHPPTGMSVIPCTTQRRCRVRDVPGVYSEAVSSEEYMLKNGLLRRMHHAQNASESRFATPFANIAVKTLHILPCVLLAPHQIVLIGIQRNDWKLARGCNAKNKSLYMHVRFSKARHIFPTSLPHG